MPVLAAALGVVVGFALGALGGGGSVLAVPSLVYLLGQSPHEATTASLVIVIASSLAGLVAHARTGHVRVREGMAFGLAGLLTSVVSAVLSKGLAEAVVLSGFALVMAMAAVLMWRSASRDRAGTGASTPDDADRSRRTSGASQANTSSSATTPMTAPVTVERREETAGGGRGNGTETDIIDDALRRDRAHLQPGRGEPPDVNAPAGDRARPSRRGVARPVVAGAGVGVLIGVFGVGGGFLAVPALVGAVGLSMADAIGTSLLVIAINSAAALATRLTGAHIDWAIVVPFAVTASAAAVVGRRVSDVFKAATLQRGFAILLALLAAWVIVDQLVLAPRS